MQGELVEGKHGSRSGNFVLKGKREMRQSLEGHKETGEGFFLSFDRKINSMDIYGW